MAIIDSVVWIGDKLKKDQWHIQSYKIIEAILEGKIKDLYVPDLVISEVINFILRKAGYNFAQETLDLFINSEKINILYTDELILQRAYQFFCQFKSLSLTDSVIVAFLEELDEKTVYSFDSGFDKIDWILRKERV